MASQAPFVDKKSYYSFRIFGKPQSKVIFLFAALGHSYCFYYLTILFYNFAGYRVIAYDASPKIIFDHNLFKFMDTGFAIVENVKKQVAVMKKQGVKKFYTHGNSMGTLYAMRSAIDIPEIDKVIINHTYGRLADNLWSWFVLRGVKNDIVKAGINKEQVENILKPLSPTTMAPLLKGKKLLLYLSKRDKVMLHDQSIQFKNALDRAGVDYVYIEHQWFGHNINIMINNLRPKIYLDFLKN